MGEDSVSQVLAEVNEIAVSKPASREKRSASWVIPVITAMLLTSGFLVYYFVYVTSQREYLANRNFRSLAVLGDQIQDAVSAHGSILEFYADLAREHKVRGNRDKERLQQFLVVRPEDRNKDDEAQETRRDYLKFLAPGFELTEVTAAASAGQEKTPPRLQVQRHSGRWQLVLTAERHGRGKQNAVQTARDYSGILEVEQLMQPLVLTLPFDDILLVSDKGDVIYQEKKAGPQFTTLSALLQAQPENAAPKAEAKNASHRGSEPGTSDAGSIARNSDELWRSKSMHLTDVTLADSHYKLFLQPVLVDSFSDDSDQTEPAREWVLCGLRSAGALEWEALSISYTAIIWFTVVFFAVAMSGPVLKVFFINRREHFRVQEVATLGLFLILLTAVATFSAMEVTGFPLNDDTENRLMLVQSRLSGAFYQELTEMREQLIKWCGSSQFHDDLGLAEKQEVVRNSPPAGSEAQTIGPPPPAEIYSFANNGFWTDDDGQQIIKWSTGRYVTPMIDLSDQTLFTHPKETFLNGVGPPFHFASVVPPNKLDNLGVMTITSADCLKQSAAQAAVSSAKTPETSANALKTVREDIAGGSAFLSAQPLSLIDPILPAGYGFAVVDEKGAVLFHSDPTRNLHENFLEESDWNRNLYAASFGHASQRSLPIRYKGRDYRASVTAIAGVSQAPWSLIVFCDLTLARTLNLQAITMAATLLLAFLAGPVILIAAWWALRRPRHAPEWLWPYAGRSRSYRLQILMLGILAVCFAFAGFGGSPSRS